MSGVADDIHTANLLSLSLRAENRKAGAEAVDRICTRLVRESARACGLEYEVARLEGIIAGAVDKQIAAKQSAPTPAPNPVARLCRDCQKVAKIVATDRWSWRCQATVCVSPVDGSVHMTLCAEERADHQGCGPDGKNFVAASERTKE